MRGGYYLLIRDLDKAREQSKHWSNTAVDSTGLPTWRSSRRSARHAGRAGDRSAGVGDSSKQCASTQQRCTLCLTAGTLAMQKVSDDVLGLKTFEKAYVVTALAQLATGRSPEAEATGSASECFRRRSNCALGRADLAMHEGRLSDASRILEDALSAARKPRRQPPPD